MKDKKSEKINLEIEKMQAEVAEITADLQRTRADFENYRKNTEVRVLSAQKLGEKKAVLAMLPMIDDIERAISHLPSEFADNAWAQNVVKMHKNLDKNLAKIGVEKIDSSAGTHFDPQMHEAVQFDDEGDGEEVILAELQPGYKLGNEILRPAMVKVGRA